MRLVAVFAIPTLLVLAGWWIWGDTIERWLTVETLEATGGWAWAAGMGLLTADFFLPMPATVVISALGYLYGTVAGGLLGAGGLMMAGLLGYGIGRWCGKSVAERWLGTDFGKGKRLFEKSGGWMVALSRALPVLPEMISCSAGLLRMPFGKFTAALACGSLPMGFVFAWVGSLGREEPVWTVVLSVAIPAVLWVAGMGLKRRTWKREGRSGLERKPEGKEDGA